MFAWFVGGSPRPKVSQEFVGTFCDAQLTRLYLHLDIGILQKVDKEICGAQFAGISREVVLECHSKIPLR
jgi:hypothetical protein